MPYRGFAESGRLGGGRVAAAERGRSGQGPPAKHGSKPFRAAESSLCGQTLMNQAAQRPTRKHTADSGKFSTAGLY